MMNKKAWLIAVAAVVLAPLVSFAASKMPEGFLTSPSTVVNCMVGDSCQLRIEASNDSFGETLGASTRDQTTYWTAGNFSGDLTVSGTSTFSGSASFAGLSITGNVTTTSLVTDIVSSFTSATTTQTLCAIRNTSGSDRVLLRADFLYTTTTVTGGSNGFTISQSSTASATGTGSNVYFNNSAVTVPTNGLRAINGTSTLVGTGAVPTIWYAGNYINYLLMNPTSTLNGTCRVVSS